MSATDLHVRTDWVRGYRSYALAWGLPTVALIAAVWIAPPARTLIWAAALSWMGTACLANARRCGRTHCFFTGPFFLVMAVVTLMHGLAIVPLGADGWTWIGVAIGVGAGALWCLSEHVLGKYRHRGEPGERRSAGA